VMLASSLVLGTVVARWMLDTFSCESFVVFLLWFLFCAAAFLPLIVFYGIGYFTDQNDHVADCKVFIDATDADANGFERGVCDVRFWTFLFGIVLLIGVVSSMFLFGLVQSIPMWTRPIRRARPNPDLVNAASARILLGPSNTARHALSARYASSDLVRTVYSRTHQFEHTRTD
jgi:hypothetical protein